MNQRGGAVLVVGGAGYIGCHAARELRRRGYEAIIYDNLSTGHKFLAEGFELIVGDIADSISSTECLNVCKRSCTSLPMPLLENR